MQYDALPWDWVGWEGNDDGDGNDVILCDAMPYHEVGVGLRRGRA